MNTPPSKEDAIGSKKKKSRMGENQIAKFKKSREKNALQLLQRNYRTSRQRITPAGNTARQVEEMLKSGKAVGRKGNDSPETVKAGKRAATGKTPAGKKARITGRDFVDYINVQARQRGIDISDM